MKVLIIEDERPNIVRLTTMLASIGSDLEIEGPLSSVEDVRQYFASGNSPQLIITDVRLYDGLVFGAFGAVDVNAHIIFTLSYSDYLINAFNSINGIQIVLKPVLPEELSAAIDRTLWSAPCRIADISALAAGILRPSIRRRFLVPWLDGFEVIKVESLAYIYNDGTQTFLCTGTGDKYRHDITIDECSLQLDSEMFFRVSDRYIVNINAVKRLTSSWGSNLRIILNNSDETSIEVNRDRALALRLWLDQSNAPGV